MIQEIKYNGFTANPSDYESADGELATAIGLVPEDGALKPVLPPKELFTLGDNRKVVFIHQTSTFKYYIVLDTSTNQTFFTDGDTEGEQFLQHLYDFSSEIEIYSFNSIGNTLLVLSSSGMHYLLWKGISEGYLYLGTHFPECHLSFGLTGVMERTDEFQFSFDAVDSHSFPNSVTDNVKSQITGSVLAQVNKFISDESTNKGKFMFPFLVRYAYRLYDGTLTMHSSPVLMVASSDCVPLVFVNELAGENGTYSSAKARVNAVLHSLDYSVLNQSCISELDNWKDIIKSVDIFISQPIYTYDQSGTCGGFVSSNYRNSYCVCRMTGRISTSQQYPGYHQRYDFLTLYEFTYQLSFNSLPAFKVALPSKDEEKVK